MLIFFFGLLLGDAFDDAVGEEMNRSIEEVATKLQNTIDSKKQAAQGGVQSNGEQEGGQNTGEAPTEEAPQ